MCPIHALAKFSFAEPSGLSLKVAYLQEFIMRKAEVC